MKAHQQKTFKRTKREIIRDKLLKAKELVRKLEKEWETASVEED